MSKKNRLEKEHQKQLERKKQLELDEESERLAARKTQSRAAKKMRRQAKSGYTNAVMIFFTLLMFVSFAYSGFFYGNVMIVGALNGSAEFIPKYIAVLMAVGNLLMFTGIIISFCRKYILQGVFSLAGGAMFMYSSLWIIGDIRERIDKYSVDPSLYELDRQYMKYLLPISGVLIFSLVILIYGIVRAAKRKRAEKIKQDNAPVKSIVDI